MSTEQGNVEVIREALLDSSNALVPGTMTEGAHQALASLARLAAALERAEREKETAEWAMTSHRTRAEKAERALAEIKGWAESGAHVENDAGRDASDFIRIAILAGADPEALRAALRGHQR